MKKIISKQKPYEIWVRQTAYLVLCIGIGIYGVACVSKSERPTGSPDEQQMELPEGSSSETKNSSVVTTAEAQAILEKALRDFKQSNKKSGNLEADKLKKLSIPAVGASESPRNDGIHDNNNGSITTLQDPTRALAEFPRDRRNQVDWVAALKMGLISPRANLKGDKDMITMDMDIIMKNTQYMPWVKFPHKPHTEWLACENCHPAIFLPREHANSISMNKVLRGKFCGVCHDKVAFAIFICERCHSVPHKGSGKKWW